MQNDKLLPCPFCDKKLKKFKGGYEHKSSQCVLSSFILTDVEISKWNTRKPMERIVEQLEERKTSYDKEVEEEPFSLHSAYLKGVRRGYIYSLEVVTGEERYAE